MLELINFANYDTNRAMIDNSSSGLKQLLTELGVDGIEALFCDPWDAAVLPASSIFGVHLNFWPTWLDFWRGDQQALLRQFGSKENIFACFGSTEPEQLLRSFRKDLKQAKAAAADYVVFHVSHNELDEIYTWQFRSDSLAVVDATLEVVNCLTPDIPPEMTVLFENLWWPGLTLLEPRLADRLLSRVHHSKVGIMLDTGHLMNTNQELRDEQQAIAYVLSVINNLGSLARSIRGVHLHQSLSGDYVKQSRCQTAPDTNLAASMAHIMRIDQHRPFSQSQAKKLLEVLQPDYLVHEFIVSSREELIRYTAQQRQALALSHTFGT